MASPVECSWSPEESGLNVAPGSLQSPAAGPVPWEGQCLPVPSPRWEGHKDTATLPRRGDDTAYCRRFTAGRWAGPCRARGTAERRHPLPRGSPARPFASGQGGRAHSAKHGEQRSDSAPWPRLTCSSSTATAPAACPTPARPTAPWPPQGCPAERRGPPAAAMAAAATEPRRHSALRDRGLRRAPAPAVRHRQGQPAGASVEPRAGGPGSVTTGVGSGSGARSGGSPRGSAAPAARSCALRRRKEQGESHQLPRQVWRMRP